MDVRQEGSQNEKNVLSYKQRYRGRTKGGDKHGEREATSLRDTDRGAATPICSKSNGAKTLRPMKNLTCFLKGKRETRAPWRGIIAWRTGTMTNAAPFICLSVSLRLNDDCITNFDFKKTLCIPEVG